MFLISYLFPVFGEQDEQFKGTTRRCLNFIPSYSNHQLILRQTKIFFTTLYQVKIMSQKFQQYNYGLHDTSLLTRRSVLAKHWAIPYLPDWQYHTYFSTSVIYILSKVSNYDTLYIKKIFSKFTSLCVTYEDIRLIIICIQTTVNLAFGVF